MSGSSHCNISTNPQSTEEGKHGVSSALSTSDSLRAVAGSNSDYCSLQQRSAVPESNLRDERLQYFFLNSFNVIDHLANEAGPPTEEEVREALKSMRKHVAGYQRQANDDSGIGTSIHSHSEDGSASGQVQRQESHVKKKRIALDEIVAWYRQWLWRWAVPCSSAQDQNVHHGQNVTANNARPGSSSKTQCDDKSNNKKRKFDGNQEHQGKDRGAKESTRNEHPSSKDRARRLRLACPFLKRNPMRDHLYSHHMFQSGITICRRCGAVFSSEAEFHSHSRQPVACTIRPVDIIEEIDAEKKDRLKNKKLARGCTEAQKWFAIFDVLFPTCNPEDYPEDPYWDPFPLRALQIAAHLHDDLPSIIINSSRDVASALGEVPSDNFIAGSIPIIQRRVRESLLSFRPGSNAQTQEDRVLQNDEIHQSHSEQRDAPPHRSAERRMSPTRADAENSFQDVYSQLDADLRDGQLIPTALGQQLDRYSLELFQFDLHDTLEDTSSDIDFAEAIQTLERCARSLLEEPAQSEAHVQQERRWNNPPNP
ncbi:hypothetical protein FHL15_010705 [Xylaria flabelliformis]|uniref:C2H2-type domain-containing protein n=1 Tax=Xylaria flabelliformis TaxID=2512241 RepID=A0A553HKB8_9PEZI|nr:hypothetical protein FHL15_010705 [Xylaria flabelliformis]